MFSIFIYYYINLINSRWIFFLFNNHQIEGNNHCCDVVYHDHVYSGPSLFYYDILDLGATVTNAIDESFFISSIHDLTDEDALYFSIMVRMIHFTKLSLIQCLMYWRNSLIFLIITFQMLSSMTLTN